MKTVLKELEKLDYVHRYAWFPASLSNRALTSSALFDEKGNLTPLGAYYSTYKNNEEVGPGKDDYVVVDDPNNVILNGNFETGDHIYWGGYNSKTVGVVTTPPHAGDFLGQINAREGSLVYETMVEAGQLYQLSLWNKWESPPPGNVKVVIRDANTNVIIYDQLLSQSTEWTQTVGQFTPGVENIRIVVWKPAKQSTIFTPALFLDDVKLKKL